MTYILRQNDFRNGTEMKNAIQKIKDIHIVKNNF